MSKQGLAVFTGILVLVAASASFAARYPAANWVPGCNTFWSTCLKPYHTGCDASGGVREAVYAPFGGTIKEAQYHGGYGGTIIGETYLAGEWITWVIGHLDGSDGFLVRSGQSVSEGQQIDQLAPSGYWTGSYTDASGVTRYYPTHFHLTIRKGRYVAGATACDGGWIYHGYSGSCDWGNFLNPMLAVPFANAHYQQGDIQKVGYPQGHTQYSCGADFRIYNGGSFGECMIIMGSNGSWLVRTGFYNKYKALGGPCSVLGKPTGNEYVWYCDAVYGWISRQNFAGGYMIWKGGTAYVYNWSGTRIASDDPLADIDGTPTVGLLVSAQGKGVVIRYSLPGSGGAGLAIYDVAGRLIRRFDAEHATAGATTIVWDRRRQDGAEVPSGVYFVRLQADGQQLVQKVVLTR